MLMKVEVTEERANSERYKKQSEILRLELDHLLQQLTVYVCVFFSGTPPAATRAFNKCDARCNLAVSSNLI